jgi:multiple sugar transport system permease protein
MAASTIMTIPVLILYLALQKYIEKGIVAGGVKG